MRKVIIFGVLAMRIFFCLVFFVAGCQFHLPNHDATDWQANWIGVPEESQPNSWLCYRNQIELNNRPRKALDYLTPNEVYYNNKKIQVQKLN